MSWGSNFPEFPMQPIAAIIIVVLTLSALFIFPGNNPLSVSKILREQSSGSELPKLYPYPLLSNSYTDPPVISAKSAVVIDAKTGVTLYEKNPDFRSLPASTTKLMTALVALERCSSENIVEINEVESSGTQMGLSVGERVTVETLIYGLLVASGNDAAYALASACSDSPEHFVTSMNQKARELGMTNTRFENPAGFDSDLQYSTARDLAKLAKVAVANPLVAKMVGTRSTVLTDVSGVKTYYLENINKLLDEVEGLEGVKTGQTEGSGEILLTKTTRDGNTIIAAVLGSLDRFGESKILIEWTFANHNWRQP